MKARPIDHSIERLNEQQETVLLLRDLQQQLRKELKRAAQQSGKPLKHIEREHGISNGALHLFLKGNTTVVSGKNLTAYGQVIQDPVLVQRIQATAQLIPQPKDQSLSAHEQAVIYHVFALRRMHRLHALEITIQDFAKFADEEDREAVAQACAGGCDPKNDESWLRAMMHALKNVYNDSFPESVSRWRKQETDKRRQLSETLNKTLVSLRSFFPSVQAMAQALEVDRSVLQRARTADKSCVTKTMDELVAKTNDLLKDRSRNTSSLPAQNKQSLPTPRPSSRSSKESLPAITSRMGTTTAEGVSFVLTEESYRAIRGDPSQLFVEDLIRAMTIARGLLNIASQLEDDEVRKKMRKTVGMHAIELARALELFSAHVPNELTRVYDQERQLRTQLGQLAPGKSDRRSQKGRG